MTPNTPKFCICATVISVWKGDISMHAEEFSDALSSLKYFNVILIPLDLTNFLFHLQLISTKLSSIRKDSQQHNRKQQPRWPRTIRIKMDQDWMQTSEHSSGSLLWTPRKWKSGKSKGNLQCPKPPTPSNTRWMRHHTSWRLQCKTKNLQRKLWASRI